MNSAVFNETGTFRYRLSRTWLGGAGSVAFIMLNPSTADADEDDPTIRRCTRFAQRWGFARLEVVNLFAYRATDPANLKLARDPVGPENDWYIRCCADFTTMIVAAWGACGAFQDRDKAVLALLEDRPIFCLGRTKQNHPRHCLYVPYSAEFESYS